MSVCVGYFGGMNKKKKLSSQWDTNGGLCNGSLIFYHLITYSASANCQVVRLARHISVPAFRVRVPLLHQREYSIKMGKRM